MTGVISHALSNTVADGGNPALVKPSNWNSAHNLALTILGNTAGVSSFNATNLFLAGGSNITLAATTDTNSNATISVVGPQNSSLQFGALGFGVQSSFFPAANSQIYIQEFVVPTELVVSRLNLYFPSDLSLVIASVTTPTTSSGINTTNLDVAFYSRGLGASTASLYLMNSTGFDLTMSWTLSITATSTLSVSVAYGYPVGFSGNAYTHTQTTLVTGTAAEGGAIFFVSLDENNNDNMALMLEVFFPMQTTLEPGSYYMANLLSTSPYSTWPGANLVSLTVGPVGYYMAGQVGQSFRYLGTTTPVIAGGLQGMSFASASFPTSVGVSALTSHTKGQLIGMMNNYQLLRD